MKTLFKKALAVVALSGAAFAAQPAAADVSWNFSVGVGSASPVQHYSPWTYRPTVPTYRPTVPTYRPYVPTYRPYVPTYRPYVPTYRPYVPHRPHGGHGHGHGGGRPNLDDAFCVAVGKRGYGHGDRIPGTRARAEVHVRRNASQSVKNQRIRQACTQAMNECRVNLRTHGGRYAICEVVNRGVQQ